jgi:hypothetical protein
MCTASLCGALRSALSCRAAPLVAPDPFHLTFLTFLTPVRPAARLRAPPAG